MTQALNVRAGCASHRDTTPCLNCAAVLMANMGLLCGPTHHSTHPRPDHRWAVWVLYLHPVPLLFPTGDVGGLSLQGSVSIDYEPGQLSDRTAVRQQNGLDIGMPCQELERTPLFVVSLAMGCGGTSR
jgi:hypothetical protein